MREERGNEMRQMKGKISKFETREDSEDLYISGYFAVFGSDYELWPGATESVADTAFDGALSDDIRCLADHETRLVLGRTRAGTLTLKTDSRGLWGEVGINRNDMDAMNLYERVKRGDVDQCSFGFDILDEEFEDRGNEVHWTIKKVKLYEVSIVTFPAYTETSVSARKSQIRDAAQAQPGSLAGTDVRKTERRMKMALRALLLRSRLDKKKKSWRSCGDRTRTSLRGKRNWRLRSEEMTEETTEEERKEVEDQTEAFQKEKEEHEQKTGELEREEERIEGEVKEEEARSAVPPQPVAPAGPAAGAPQTERKGERTMTMRGKDLRT